jgi:hypothetical protein
MTLVSIIITVYNRDKFLSFAIESALNQSYKDLEVIVVNDGSIDKSGNVATQYPVKYVFQKNKGAASAKKLGVSVSKGEFFCCLDSDDILHPEYIQRCTDEMQNSDKNAFVWTGTTFFGDINKIASPIPLVWRYSTYRLLGSQIGGALTRRKAYDEIGGFDASYKIKEDRDLMIRIALNGWNCRCINEPLYYCRTHSGQLSSTGKHERWLSRKHPILPFYNFYYFILRSFIELMRDPRISLRRLNSEVRRRLFSLRLFD